MGAGCSEDRDVRGERRRGTFGKETGDGKYGVEMRSSESRRQRFRRTARADPRELIGEERGIGNDQITELRKCFHWRVVKFLEQIKRRSEGSHIYDFSPLSLFVLSPVSCRFVGDFELRVKGVETQCLRLMN